MKTVFRLNGKKVTKKSLIEKFGKERVDKWIEESKETFMEDTLIANDWWIGNGNVVTVSFE